MRASNVVVNTTVRIARKAGIPPQNAPFVAETTRPITKDANAITILSAVEFHIDTPNHRHHAAHGGNTPTPPPIAPQQTQQLRTYADVVNNRPQISDDPITTLTTFLEEFENLFSQLIHQNSMILNMLTTLLNKSH